MDNSEKHFISIQKCRIQSKNAVLIPEVTWTMSAGEAWLVIGPNGGGKSAFLRGLAGDFDIVPNIPESDICAGDREWKSCFTEATDVPLYATAFSNSVETVSLERAAALIEEERRNDESDYIEGGVDPGRTGRRFLCEVTHDDGSRLESNPQVKLCGIEKILDRGLKYMSTGEIRRTLLCRALLSAKRLLILSDPFAGLDVSSRSILLDFLDFIEAKQLSGSKNDSGWPMIVLGMERYTEIPVSVTHVLEFTANGVSFCGKKALYEKLLEERQTMREKTRDSDRSAFEAEIRDLHAEAVERNADFPVSGDTGRQPLVRMKNVTVRWDDHIVLSDLSWALYPDEHWLIRGPNGSGKTTFLELITGDNMQVFCNDVSLFGNRRGSGESIWEVKAKLGIVSYRLHVEYRMVGGTDLESVIISGIHDTIGLYEPKSDVEVVSARKWLKLGGFAGRETASFSSLSYGEQRAVLILRAAVKCPPVLILDEPCHGLDSEYRQKILDLLETIAESGTTTLLHVTHDPDEVLSCEKHILELHPDEQPMYRILIRE